MGALADRTKTAAFGTGFGGGEEIDAPHLSHDHAIGILKFDDLQFMWGARTAFSFWHIFIASTVDRSTIFGLQAVVLMPAVAPG